MSVSEKIVEKTLEAIERDLHSIPVVRRALWHGVAGAALFVFFLAVFIGTVTSKTGIKDAFEGGRMAKVALPILTDDVAEIRLDVERIAGAVDILAGRGLTVMTAAQDEAYPRPACGNTTN